MNSALAHRGPDDEGVWVDPEGRCILGHRRLKVIDVSEAGRQPMVAANGRQVIVTNGEIYNFREVKPLLETRGVVFRGRSDTEVLLESISVWHEDALNRLDGMFAFAIFDTETGELLLARDPFGEKPLYYVELGNGGLAFASELHALTTVPRFDSEVSLDAMAELMMFQYVGHPRTIYRSARKLPPGHWLRVGRDGRVVVERYFRLEAGSGGFENRSISDVADELEEYLVRSIQRRLISDVPVGAFLSGGVDSSTVCALTQKRAGHGLRTFSIGFREAPESEHLAARSFADHLGLVHHQRILSPDIVEMLPRLGQMMDEPNVDWSCLPVYLLSELARQEVTVAISGDGGDEMFVGYPWYFPPLDMENVASTTGRQWSADEEYSASLLMTGGDTIERLFGSVPQSVRARIRRIRDEINETSSPLVFRLRRNELENYLPGAVLAKVDRMSMQHALEVRTPFLNVEIARFAARLPAELLYGAGQGKLVLREVAYRYLPRELIDRPKMGFGVPGSDWAGPEIRTLAQTLLGSEESRLRACLGGKALDDFLVQDPDPHRQWALIILESWLRSHPVRLAEVVRDRAFGN